MKRKEDGYRICSKPDCEGPLIRGDISDLCQSHKLSEGVSWMEARDEIISRWRELIGIQAGDSRETVLDKFLEWQSSKRTCERCEGKEYASYCPIKSICKEAMDHGRQIDIGSGDTEDIRVEETGVGTYEKQFEFDFCESI